MIGRGFRPASMLSKMNKDEPKRRYRDLSVDKIVDAALDLISARGADALSMRLVAATLGVSTMSTYHHVPSKDRLIELVIDKMYRDLSVRVLNTPIQDQPRDWFWRLRENFRPYPEAIILGVGRSKTGKSIEVLRILDESRTLYRAAGFIDAKIDALIGATSYLMYGSLKYEMSFSRKPRDLKERIDEELSLIYLGASVDLAPPW